MRITRVVLADDHPLIRAGLRTAFSEAPDIALVGEAKDGEEACQLCDDLKPDVLLIDLRMPGPKAKEIVLDLKKKSPQLKILVLTAYQEETLIRGLITLGINGYILKDEAIEALVRAIYAVMAGDTWFSRQVVQILAEPISHTEPSTPENSSQGSPLSLRETEILQYLAQGFCNAQIALQACISERTARHYVQQIMEKVGATNRTKAVVIALQKGWVKL